MRTTVDLKHAPAWPVAEWRRPSPSLRPMPPLLRPAAATYTIVATSGSETTFAMAASGPGVRTGWGWLPHTSVLLAKRGVIRGSLGCIVLPSACSLAGGADHGGLCPRQRLGAGPHRDGARLPDAMCCSLQCVRHSCRGCLRLRWQVLQPHHTDLLPWCILLLRRGLEGRRALPLPRPAHRGCRDHAT